MNNTFLHPIVKLFNMNSMEMVKACQEYLSFELPSVTLSNRVIKFGTVCYGDAYPLHVCHDRCNL